MIATKSHSFGSALASAEIGCFSLSLTRYESGAVLPWHDHSLPYLTVVVDGSYRETVSGAARECTRRRVIYHPAGERHSDQFHARSTCLDVHFDEQWLGALSLRGCATGRPAFFDSSAAARIGSRLQDELRDGDGFSPLVIEGLLMELFVEKERVARASTAPRWLRRVRENVEASLPFGVSLRELARDAGVHPAHLARSFRSHYGSSVGQLLRARRIEMAKDRLRSGAALADIALDLGFADQSHFSRTFRKCTGHTPAEFRRSVR